MASEMEFDTREFDLLIAAAEGLQPVTAEIITTDPKGPVKAAVLEAGSRDGEKPWPRPWKRTTEGEGRVFSKQAVGGWIAKHAGLILGYLSDSYHAVVTQTKGAPNQEQLQSAVDNGAKKSLEFLKKVAPVDTGEFRDSLQIRKSS